jgi:hypothetical protein
VTHGRISVGMQAKMVLTNKMLITWELTSALLLFVKPVTCGVLLKELLGTVLMARLNSLVQYGSKNLSKHILLIQKIKIGSKRLMDKLTGCLCTLKTIKKLLAGVHQSRSVVDGVVTLFL